MALTEILLGKRTVILERWLQAVLESYPEQARHFLRQVKDPFANPVGATLSKGLVEILDGLLEGSDPTAVAPALDSLIKIFSVQGLMPSQALAFIFNLKQIVREVTQKEPAASVAASEVLAFDAKVDALALSAFDCYAANREKICEIRIGEMKRSLFVIERACMPLDADDLDPEGPKPHDGSLQGGPKP